LPTAAKLVASYVSHTGDYALFCEAEPALRAGLAFVNRSDDGLAYNSVTSPNSR
jgi:hypothetical protein